MLNKADAWGRGRSQELVADAEAEANFWPTGQSGLEDLTTLVSTRRESVF